MDRSRRLGTTPSDAPVPPASRLTVRPKKNRRKAGPPASLWSRVPRPRAVVVACGRMARRSLPLLGATAIGLVLAGGIWLGHRFVTTSDRFAITAIDIQISGASRLSADEIRAALPIAVGDNIFAADLDALEERVRHAQPWLARVEAHRVLPHTVVVEVREHAAAGIAAFDSEWYLVDTAGQPFMRVELVPDLPVVSGLSRADYERDPSGTSQMIAAALATVAAWQAQDTRPAIRELRIDEHHGLTLVTRDTGATIQVGALGTPIADRLRTFDAAWAELSEEERLHARAFHLDTQPDHVTVAFAKD